MFKKQLTNICDCAKLILVTITDMVADKKIKNNYILKGEKI